METNSFYRVVRTAMNRHLYYGGIEALKYIAETDYTEIPEVDVQEAVNLVAGYMETLEDPSWPITYAVLMLDPFAYVHGWTEEQKMVAMVEFLELMPPPPPVSSEEPQMEVG